MTTIVLFSQLFAHLWYCWVGPKGLPVVCLKLLLDEPLSSFCSQCMRTSGCKSALQSGAAAIRPPLTGPPEQHRRLEPLPPFTAESSWRLPGRWRRSPPPQTDAGLWGWAAAMAGLRRETESCPPFQDRAPSLVCARPAQGTASGAQGEGGCGGHTGSVDGVLGNRLQLAGQLDSWAEAGRSRFPGACAHWPPSCFPIQAVLSPPSSWAGGWDGRSQPLPCW